MARHRSNADDDTAPITGILRKMVKLSNDNQNRKTVQKCGDCNGKGNDRNCSCAGTGNATTWS